MNDPVADKLLRQSSDLPKLSPPEDKGITSLYIGGLSNEVSERDLRWFSLSLSLSLSLSFSLFLSLSHSIQKDSWYEIEFVKQKLKRQ